MWSRSRKTAGRKPAAEAGPADWEVVAAARFPAGPLAVLDVAVSGKALVAYLADGTRAATARAGRAVADVARWGAQMPVRQIPSRYTMIIAIQDPLSQQTLAANRDMGCNAGSVLHP